MIVDLSSVVLKQRTKRKYQRLTVNRFNLE